jgi:hypothetical protein
MNNRADCHQHEPRIASGLGPNHRSRLREPPPTRKALAPPPSAIPPHPHAPTEGPTPTPLRNTATSRRAGRELLDHLAASRCGQRSKSRHASRALGSSRPRNPSCHDSRPLHRRGPISVVMLATTAFAAHPQRAVPRPLERPARAPVRPSRARPEQLADPDRIAHTHRNLATARALKLAAAELADILRPGNR